MQSKKHICLIGFLIVICPFIFNGLYNQTLENTTAVFWLADILAMVVIPTIVFVILLKKDALTLKSIGVLPLPRSIGQILKFIIVIIVLTAGLFFIYTYVWIVVSDYFKQNYLATGFSYATQIQKTGKYATLFNVYASLTAGVVEEVYYRGVFRTIFSDSTMGKVAFVLCSSAVFSAVHWELGVVFLIATFVFGLAASTYYSLSKSLLPLVIAHSCIDFLYFL
jgi:membrane protease YdiL (CAAX protease family)